MYDLNLQFLDIQATQPICTQVTTDYDRCILEESCKQMKERIFPFCTNDYYPINNVSRSEALFREYKINFFSKETREEKCHIPCSFYAPALTSTELHNEGVTLASNDKNWGAVHLTINYPTEVTTKRAYVYFTEINLISELGGWFGLLFGFSVFDLCCFFFDFLTRNLSLKINWILNKPAIYIYLDPYHIQ